MTCAQVREMLMEGDPALLTEGGHGDLAAHLQECAACGVIASRLAADHQMLTSAYQDASPRGGAAETVAHATAPTPKGTIQPIRWRRWGMVGVGIAAAALLTFTVRRDSSVTSPPPPAIPVDSVASSLSVEVPPGRNALITSTRDPNISVVWFY